MGGCGVNSTSASKAPLPPIQAGMGTPSEPAKLRVHFLDVGQADSILIQGSKGQTILIDGGNNDDAAVVIAYLKNQGVKQLDAVVATHPHEDHIGGLDKIIQAFPVSAVYLPNKATTTRTFKDFISAVKDSGAKKAQAKLGVKIEVPGIDAFILAPAGNSYDSLNNYSAVVKVIYGDTAFLFMGDAESESEKEILLQSKISPQAQLLKVGHHGSISSTGIDFLKAVNPKIAVISVGADNDYEHPHKETLSKLAAARIAVYRTDQLGTIVAASDGKNIKIEK